MEERQIQFYLADTVIERPYAFEISGQPFYIYPVTLGKSYLLARLTENLNLDAANLGVNPYIEALRICTDNRADAIRLIVYHTFSKKEELFDYKLVENRCSYFDDNLDCEEIANLLITVMSYDKTEQFVKYLGIDKDEVWKKKVSNLKSEQGCSVSFGGKSVYGTLIDFACERYGWSYEYVLWGISLVNLKMMMRDSISTQYLTKEEQKKLRIPTDRTYISGDSKENIARFKKYFSD